jgi:hypothetical protein
MNKPSVVPRKRFLSKYGPTPAERKWRPIVEDWRQSGQEASTFCRGLGLALSAFKYWKKELPLRDQRRKSTPAVSKAKHKAIRMLPVRIVEPLSNAALPIEIVARDGRILRVAGDFDPAVLRKLLAALEEPR